MKNILSLKQLQQETAINENTWLLLYKKGSAQSDCAFENLLEAEEKVRNAALFAADVNQVKDIHPVYEITSVPSLLQFEKGQMKRMIKGCLKPEQFHVIFEKPAMTVVSDTEKKAQKNVTVYTTPTCSWCTTIKRHLQENGIRYREIDVSRDQKAAEEMIRKSGQQGVPQTDINGEIIVGFDKTRINLLLGIN
jgi:glutaredoxin-like YruB-family protein